MIPSTANNEEAREETLQLFGTSTIEAAMVNTTIEFGPYAIEIYGEHKEKVFESVCKGYPNCIVQIEED